MVNEHSTTKLAENFFPVSNPARKMDEKNHLSRNSNSVTETEIKIRPECLTSWDDKKLCTNRNVSI